MRTKTRKLLANATLVTLLGAVVAACGSGDDLAYSDDGDALLAAVAGGESPAWVGDVMDAVSAQVDDASLSYLAGLQFDAHDAAAIAGDPAVLNLVFVVRDVLHDLGVVSFDASTSVEAQLRVAMEEEEDERIPSETVQKVAEFLAGNFDHFKAAPDYVVCEEEGPGCPPILIVTAAVVEAAADAADGKSPGTVYFPNREDVPSGVFLDPEAANSAGLDADGKGPGGGSGGDGGTGRLEGACTGGSTGSVNGISNVVCVDAGVFEMGCKEGRDDVDIGCGPSEENVHQVTLTRDFWIMEAEVTRAQWRSLMGNNPSKNHNFSDSGPADCDTCGVDGVNLYEAAEFANRLNDTLGLPRCYDLVGCQGKPGDADDEFACDEVLPVAGSGSNYDCAGWRLPSEAEWELAARGGESFAYPGSNNLDDVAWWGYQVTHEVCTKARNGFGLCDMAGNVAEWTYGIYEGFYTSDDKIDPEGATTSEHFEYYVILRGGHAKHQYESYLTIANRDGAAPRTNRRGHGFRLVRTASQ